MIMYLSTFDAVLQGQKAWEVGANYMHIGKSPCAGRGFFL